MSFIQIVEYETEQPDELNALLDQARPDQSFTRLAVAHDRENPNHHYMIVEFPSYEEAMENSAKPETDAMARQMGTMTTMGPIYHNLDVEMEEE
jgi:hypothetical protein